MGADLLSAASLLIAAITVLYGLWHREIEEALKLKIRLLRASRDRDIEHVESLLRRAAMLAAVNWLVVLVFLPASLDILRRAFRVLSASPLRAWHSYDTANAAFIVVFGIGIVLGCASYHDFHALRHKLKKLRQPDL